MDDESVVRLFVDVEAGNHPKLDSMLRIAAHLDIDASQLRKRFSTECRNLSFKLSARRKSLRQRALEARAVCIASVAKLIGEKIAGVSPTITRREVTRKMAKLGVKLRWAEFRNAKKLVLEAAREAPGNLSKNT